MAAVQSEAQKSGDMAVLLLAHYDQHARDLPWRSPPGSPPPPPYRVWLSEVMLQQTTVAAVIPYFTAFTERWPRVEALAMASDADVMAAWAGLGYYSRARNLLKCARVVVDAHIGNFPQSAAELAKLPGVGAYTSAAIAAIAFGEPVAVVDANVERVAARLFAIQTPLPAARPAIREAVQAITPTDRPGDFAQAMMDLGATICTPRNPSCLTCPLRTRCKAYALGIVEDLPVKAPKAPKPQRTGTAWWIECDGHVWLAKRPDKIMLGGMRALLDDDWSVRTDGHKTHPLPAQWQKVNGQVAHSFTHFHLALDIQRTHIQARANDLANGEWWPINSLDSAGLPTLFAKVARLVLKDRKAQEEE
ncbi:MAG: A/G-specific adenine glycosylase [Sphingomonadales bacterium]|nr:A/G-specific adenine glycosylase [Sphingomonadales bacterium]